MTNEPLNETDKKSLEAFVNEQVHDKGARIESQAVGHCSWRTPLDVLGTAGCLAAYWLENRVGVVETCQLKTHGHGARTFDDCHSGDGHF